jgi:hypothetical protein
MTFDGLDGQGLGYLGRFTLVHVLAYVLVGAVFLSIQDAIPAADRVAIDFFEPYRPIGITVLGWELVRGALLAVVLSPFYGDILGRDRGWLVLFTAVLGLTIVGSVEPMAGSIEGVLYTETTAVAHLAVLGASVVGVGLFTGAFFWWERRATTDVSGGRRNSLVDREVRGAIPKYVGRFTVVHVVTYVLAGIAFFELQDYETAFATMEAFELYRPLDGAVGILVFPTQIVRGAFLAALLVPFYSTIFRHDRGWLYLFGLFLGMTLFGAPNLLQEFVETLASGSLAEAFVGTAEVTVQMAVFSLLLWWWERRSLARRDRTASEARRTHARQHQ